MRRPSITGWLIAVPWVLTALAALLKTTQVITCGWWWVALPLWLPVLIYLITLFFHPRLP